MKRLSILTKVMFCIVAVLLVVTIALSIANAVKDGKNKETQGTTATVTPIPTKPAATTVTPEATPTETPTPTPEPVGRKIALDPGQQKSEMKEEEPLGPGAPEGSTVKKMSYGATSVTNNKREYEWSLPFTLKLKEELAARGYEVVLTREEDDVKISNAERARFANESGADVYISIQADAAGSSAHGIYSQIPSQGNRYVGDMYSECKRLADALQTALIAETGANDRGLREDDKVAAINWSEIPVTVLQLGFMSNAEEDAKLWSEDYQAKMIKAICDGLDKYFSEGE